MPVEDGYSFIRRFREWEGNRPQIPAVALTAYARTEDRTEAILAGFQNHLSKPVDPAELLAVVASLAAKHR
jgi:CheY-like chemotaxis protein